MQAILKEHATIIQRVICSGATQIVSRGEDGVVEVLVDTVHMGKQIRAIIRLLPGQYVILE